MNDKGFYKSKLHNSLQHNINQVLIVYGLHVSEGPRNYEPLC